MGITLSKTEQDTLLSKITSKDLYNDVLAFLEGKFEFPFSDEQMQKIAAKAKKDVLAGKGTSIDDMRNLIHQ